MTSLGGVTGAGPVAECVPGRPDSVTRSPDRNAASCGRDEEGPLHPDARVAHPTLPAAAATSQPLRIMGRYVDSDGSVGVGGRRRSLDLPEHAKVVVGEELAGLVRLVEALGIVGQVVKEAVDDAAGPQSESHPDDPDDCMHPPVPLCEI